VALAIRSLASLELLSLSSQDTHGLLSGDPQSADHPRVQHFHPSGRDGAHGDLLMPWYAELPHDANIERRSEEARHLERHGYSSPRQSEHHEVRGRTEWTKDLPEPPPCLTPVHE
jgi:hypothetical protein